VEAGREKLSCLNPSCGTSIQDLELILTGDRIAYQSYDILFNPNQFLQHNQNFPCYLMLLKAASRTKIPLLKTDPTWGVAWGAVDANY